MARIVFEENYEVYFGASAPADPDAPTVAEISAMSNITGSIPKDGFNPGVSNNRVSAASLATKFDAEIMGSHGAQLSVTAFMDDTTNTAFDTFGVREATGCFVAIWDGGGNVAGSKCFVWPYVQAGSPMLPTTAANERQTFTSEFAVGGDGTEPSYHAEVAA